MVGPHVTDLIEAGTVALDAEATVETVADGMAAHPTLSEGIKEAGLVGARTRDPHAEPQARRRRRVAVSENGSFAVRATWRPPAPPSRDPERLCGRRSSSRRADRAFEQLYKRHAREVYQYALALLANPADAEDVTQTTFLNAYRAFQKGERPHKPHNWLIAITHNVCRMRWRQAGSRPREVALDEAPEPVARDDEQPNARRGPDRARSAVVQPARGDRDARARRPQLPGDLRRARRLGERGRGAALPGAPQPAGPPRRARRAHDGAAPGLARLVHRRRGRRRRGRRRGCSAPTSCSRRRPSSAWARRPQAPATRASGRCGPTHAATPAAFVAPKRRVAQYRRDGTAPSRTGERSRSASRHGAAARRAVATSHTTAVSRPTGARRARSRQRSSRATPQSPPPPAGSGRPHRRLAGLRAEAAASAAAGQHPAAAAASAASGRSRRPAATAPATRCRRSSNPSAGCKIRPLAASFR